jgi:hypothetical protein
MNTQMYTNSLERQMFRKFLFRNVNLRRFFGMPGSLVTITPIVAAIARAPFSRVSRVFIFTRGFRGCSAFSTILFLNQLRDAKEIDVRKIREKTLRISSSEQNRLKTNLGKLSTRDALDSLLPAGKPELPCESGSDNLHILVWWNSGGAQSVGKLREFFTKCREIRAVKVIKELQDSLD